MKKRNFPIFILLMLLLTCSVLAAEQNEQGKYPYFPLVHDEAQTMTKEEKQSMEDTLQKISNKHNIRVALYTMKEVPSGKEIREVAKTYLFEHYRNLEISNGSIIFVQVTGNRAYQVVTDNNMRQIITDKEGYPYLEDQFLPHLKDNKNLEAYRAYAEGVDYLCSYYEKEGKAYNPSDQFNIPGLLIGIIISLLLGGGFYYYLESGMSNVHAKNDAEDYFDNNSFQLNQSDDIYVYTSTQVIPHKRDDDNSSSGSSSSSDSGGGGGRY